MDFLFDFFAHVGLPPHEDFISSKTGHPPAMKKDSRVEIERS
ncbi:hypothetical protein [Novacetimonas maltaceti]|nr:hypothetical protein [Novacetimonas maltaceti]